MLTMEDVKSTCGKNVLGRNGRFFTLPSKIKTKPF